MKTVVIMVIGVFCVSAVADDRCYYQPYYEEVNNLTVLNRHLSIAPIKASVDKLSEKLVLQVYNSLLDTMPITSQPVKMRQFQFTKNWPVTPASVQTTRTQQVQFQTSTQILQGVIDQRLIIQDGLVATSQGVTNVINSGSIGR